MNIKSLFIFIVLFVFVKIQAQVNDTIISQKSEEIMDTVSFVIPKNEILNPRNIASFLLKLNNLENLKSGKINIVHIGDSHLQADILSGKIRNNFQNKYGNAGRGFIFPYKIAGTNGANDIKFTSSNNWESYRVVKPISDAKVGLSGIALSTKDSIFSIEFSTKDVANYFNTFKIITPNDENYFALATQKITTTSEQVTTPTQITHKVVRRDALQSIARKYGVTVASLKSLNHLKSNKIKKGQTLLINSTPTQTKIIEHTEFDPMYLESNGVCRYFSNGKINFDKITIIPNNAQYFKEYVINGVVLENDNSGVLYHNIGVNGAKFSDYNKYPLFFQQLQALTPDLIIVSLGTNESFDKLNSDDFIAQLQLFVNNVKEQNPNAEFLFTTPQPSYLPNRVLNNYVEEYSKKLIEFCNNNQYAVCDMFSQLGGIKGACKNLKLGFLGNDGVHFTIKGYEQQANLLYEAIENAFLNYKKL
jgi:LysM repeat protein